MTIFELVKAALDTLYAEAEAMHGQRVDEVIRSRMGYLTASYTQLNSATRAPVDYQDPATRFAYVYKYVAAHGDYVVQILKTLRTTVNQPLFSEETVRVSCVGGGPGSDIIAVLKYLDEEKAEPVKKVICYLLDKEQAWADTWTELDDSLEVDVSLHANFQPLDVASPLSWRAQRRFLQADLFTLSYFVSEVKGLDVNGQVSEFWNLLFSEAKSGALFLYDDNGHSDFNDYFDQRWMAAGLQPILTADNTRFTPRFSEQASELAFYQKKFAHNPKIQAFISYRVLRKP